MNAITSKVMTVGGLLLLALVSGVILSKLGRPLNTPVFTIHKLSALVGIVLLVININKLVKAGTVPSLTIIMIVVTGVLFVGLVASGISLSFEKPVPQIFLRVHQVLPLLALAASSISYYLLVGSEVVSRAGLVK